MVLNLEIRGVFLLVGVHLLLMLEPIFSTEEEQGEVQSGELSPNSESHLEYKLLEPVYAE